MSITAYSNRTSKKCVLPFILLAGASLSFAQFPVTTYHYNNSRTGWNSSETILTPANVNSTTFGVLKTVALDDQVDGQPLVVPNVKITAGPIKACILSSMWRPKETRYTRSTAIAGRSC
jgi:hypothetical protein